MVPKKPGTAPNMLLQALKTGNCLTVGQLIECQDLTRRQVSNAATLLLRRNYLERMGAGCYQLTPSGRVAAEAGEEITSGPKGPTGKVPQHRDTFRERALR